jgi:broad specificity phosphatase PhoE
VESGGNLIVPYDTREFVRLTALLALATAALLAAVSPLAAQQAVFLVRHAEKVDESDDPPLSSKGEARAEALARHLAGAGVQAIFVTQYRRTGLTAAPLAKRLGIAPVTLRADEVDELVERLRARHAGDVVLYVGHSNTVPGILKAYGHAAPVEIRHDEYDDLFVLVPRPGAPPTVLRLKF